MISSSPSSAPSRSTVTGEGKKGAGGRKVPGEVVSSIDTCLISAPLPPRRVYTWSWSGDGVALNEVATTFRAVPSW